MSEDMSTQTLYTLKAALRKATLSTLKAIPEAELEQQCQLQASPCEKSLELIQ